MRVSFVRQHQSILLEVYKKACRSWICHGRHIYIYIYISWLCVFNPWWRHQMWRFSASLTICAGIHRSPVNYPHKGQWRGALMFSLTCAWKHDWVNNGEAGDLRRHGAHYDVIVMQQHWFKMSMSHNPHEFEAIILEGCMGLSTYICIGICLTISPYLVCYETKE